MSLKTVAVVDYGMGNLRSVSQAVRHVAQSSNPLGFVEPGDDTLGVGVWGDRCFMQDFFTGAWGYALALDLPVSSTSATKMAAFFAYNAKQIVGRLGLSTGWWYINAAPYNVAVAPADYGTADWTGGRGPWYPDFAAAYAVTYASPTPWLGSSVGVLAGEILPGANSFWGNLQPAIAYAVRHSVPGAAAAYQRMTSASNWANLAAQFNSVPVWSVVSAR